MSMHLRSERGYTFVELLVVMILVGILAAIALPAFLRQQEGGFDAEAKSRARNLLAEVESCFTGDEDYRSCDSAAELELDGIVFGSGPGEVRVSAPSASSFRIVATSRGESGGTNREFAISRPGSGAVVRTCGAAGGGCPASGVW